MVPHPPQDHATVGLRTSATRCPLPSVPAGLPAPPQLQQVVRPADQLSLALAVRQATTLEPADPPTRLGLAEHRLDDLTPLLVQPPATLRQKLALHPPARAQTTGDATPGRRCLPHLLPLLPVLARRHEQLRSVGIGLLEVLLAAIPGIDQ